MFFENTSRLGAFVRYRKNLFRPLYDASLRIYHRRTSFRTMKVWSNTQFLEEH